MKKIPGDIAKNHDNMLHYSWDTMHDRCNSYFLFWAIFCPFSPLTTQKNDNFKKIKSTPGDIIISHMYNKNNDHMMYGSWNMVCNGRTDRQMEKVIYGGGCPTWKGNMKFFTCVCKYQQQCSWCIYRLSPLSISE